MEIRTINQQFKTRADEDGKLHMKGYFSVFNKEYEFYSEDNYSMIEKMGSRAFDETLEIDDIRALTNHDTTLVLGRNVNNTLTLGVDEKGLYGDIIVNELDTDAMNTYRRVERGDVSQCSIGFDILEESYTDEITDNGQVRQIYTIDKVKLWEVSIVTFPAYKDTSVSTRTAERLEEKAEIEKRKIESLKAEVRKILKGEKNA